MAKKWTDASDDKFDAANGIAEGSPRDLAMDQAHGVPETPDEMPQAGSVPAGPVGRSRPAGGISDHYAQISHQRPNSRKPG